MLATVKLEIVKRLILGSFGPTLPNEGSTVDGLLTDSSVGILDSMTPERSTSQLRALGCLVAVLIAGCSPPARSSLVAVDDVIPRLVEATLSGGAVRFTMETAIESDSSAQIVASGAGTVDLVEAVGEAESTIYALAPGQEASERSTILIGPRQWERSSDEEWDLVDGALGSFLQLGDANSLTLEEALRSAFDGITQLESTAPFPDGVATYRAQAPDGTTIEIVAHDDRVVSIDHRSPMEGGGITLTALRFVEFGVASPSPTPP